MDYADKIILFVDDTEEILNMEIAYMYKKGFRSIETAVNCEQAEKIAREKKPDLIVLDVMLPDGNGFGLYSTIRKFSSAPILFLSARDEDVDRLVGLGLGADDYVTKPFLPEELYLRICNVLRRAYPVKLSNVLQLGDKRIDLGANLVISGQGENALTAKEYKILEKLLENRGNIVTIDSLCEAIWSEENFGYENTLMVHMRRLREKIEEDPSHPQWITTVRGLGYRLEREHSL